MIFGLRRMAGAICTAAVLGESLLFSRSFAPAWSDYAAAVWLHWRGITEEVHGNVAVAWEHGYPEMKLHLQQFLSFAITVAIYVLALVASELAVCRLERVQRSRIIPLLACAGSLAVTVTTGYQSTQLAWLAPLFLLTMACFIAGGQKLCMTTSV